MLHDLAFREYMQQRYYDAELGVFPSTDPVTPFSPGGAFNRYWYGAANPYRFTDPDGRTPNEVYLASGGAWGSGQTVNAGKRKRSKSYQYPWSNVGSQYTGRTPAAAPGQPFGPFRTGYIPAVDYVEKSDGFPSTKYHWEVSTIFGRRSSSFNLQAAGPGFGIAVSKGVQNSGDRASLIVGAGYKATYDWNLITVSKVYDNLPSSSAGVSLGGDVDFHYGAGLNLQFILRSNREDYSLRGGFGFGAGIQAGSVDYNSGE